MMMNLQTTTTMTKILLVLAGGLAGCDRAADKVSTTANAPSPASVDDNKTQTATDSTQATCKLVAVGESGVTGTVNFVQDGEVVKITGEVKGLEPGKHGFHVHEKGDLSDREAGKSAGGHFNPTDQPHGKKTAQERHVGDLGNIEANADGVATIDMKDSVISLIGEHSIVGRSIVVHADPDQFTQPTGDAGARVAFGKIEMQP